MLTYKIFLNTDMTIKDVISSGNLVQYSWNNISVNVYIPKAIYETSPSISNTVSMTFTQTKENGDTVITNNARLYEFSYVKDNVMVGNIEYVLLTRQMPQQMTLYFGNTQKFQINHLVISDNEIISFAQSPLYQYEVFQASNTQEIHDEPSTVDELQADINRAKEDIESLKTHKQDKASTNIHVRTTSAVDDDPQQFTTSVESGLNVLSNRTDDLEVDNKKNKEDIADIKATMTSQFTPLGKLDGNTAEPTLAQINAWLSAQGITQLELGDLITYVGHVSGAVDTNYNCLYTKNGWIWYETTSLETASNTEMGIVKGNGNNSNANEVIDIQNGEIQGIKVKDMNGTQRYLKGYINDLEDKQAKILDGTTTVPKANNSQNDGLGNNIQATYQTKVIGASKQYVKDYALAKMFNELNYINYDANHTDIGHSFVGGNIQKTVSTIGDVKLFDAYYKTTAYEYELSQNNVFSISLPIMLNVSKATKIKVVVKCDNNATDNTDTPFVIGTAESDNISFVANQVSKVDIQGTFASLTQPIAITPEKQLVVEVYIFNTDMQSFEINIYNTLSHPSTFTLTIPYQTIQIIEGGAIGQQYLHAQCQYNATATSSLGVGWVFDIDTELVNNTEHKFIATIDEHSHQNAFIRVASGGIEIPVIATFEEGEEQQLYFNGDHRKFIYTVDNDTSIIMFSAFYTNGQFIIVEPNDIDYARELDVENIVDGNTIVGKARADENGNNIVTTYATKEDIQELQIESENIDEKVSTNTNSYTTDKPYAVLNKLGGMSYKSENLLVLEDVASTTVNGITYSVKDGVITLNGTTTAGFGIPIYFNPQLNIGNCIFTLFNSLNVSAGRIDLSLRTSTWNVISNLMNITPSTPSIVSRPQSFDNNNTYALLYIYFINGATFNGTFKPMLVKGSTAPTEYSQGFAGIRDTIITKVNDLYISNDIKSLDGYGWGINDTCYNYIDFDRKVFVKKVDRVDLGTLNYSLYSGRTNIFVVYNVKNRLNMKLPNDNNTVPLLSNIKYTTTSLNILLNESSDKNISLASWDGLAIKDTTYSDANTFKASVKGIILYYELETPIETDISDYLDGKVVKTNRNIVFDNEYNYPVPSEFTLTISDNNVLSQDNVAFIKEEYKKSSNLLNLPDVASTTVNGITYKIKNGVITLNGTATDTINRQLCAVLVPAGTYYFKSFGATGTNSTYFTQFEQITPLGTVLAYSYDNKSITLTTNMYIIYRIVVRQGETLSNIQFKDMLVNGDNAPIKFYPYNGNIVHEKDLVDLRNELPLIKTFNGTYEQWLAQNIADSRVIKMKVILLLQEDDTPSYVDANCGYSADDETTEYLYYKYETSEYRQVSATNNVIVYYI